MKRIVAHFVLLTCVLQEAGCASGGSVPKAPSRSVGSVYELTVEQKFLDAGAKITNTISRNGDRERIETRIERGGASHGAAGQPSVTTTLYDFAAKKVYWSGHPGQDALPGGCAWGNYRSTRAPFDEDFVTGTPDTLRKMAEGRERRAEGASVVNGMAAHSEVFVGGKKPTSPQEAAVWPVRVFLADDSGTLLKAEAEGPDGKPVTLFEVTRLIIGAPAGKPFEPPKGCTFGNSEMDDSGTIKAHAEVNVKLEAGASMDAATGSTSSAVTVESNVAPVESKADARPRQKSAVKP